MRIDDEAEREGVAINHSFKSDRPSAGHGSRAPLVKCGAKDARRLRKAQLDQAFKVRSAGLNDHVSPAMVAYLNGTNAEITSLR